MAAAMKDVVGAAAGLTGLVLESARDLLQYMVRRGQMTQEEADKLMREVILNGLVKMPGWKYTLKDQDISDIIAYVRTLPEPPPPTNKGGGGAELTPTGRAALSLYQKINAKFFTATRSDWARLKKLLRG